MSQVVLLRTNAVHYLLEKSSHQWFRVTKTFLQRICATSMCDSIPLLYTEGMLFPFIFYAMVPDNGSQFFIHWN